MIPDDLGLLGTDRDTSGSGATSAAPTVDAAPTDTSRRFGETITAVDLWAVLKFSLCFYLAAMAILCIALLVLLLLADAVGVKQSVEHFMGSLLRIKHFTFVTAGIVEAVLLVGAVVVMVLTIVTVISGALYNVFANLFGGVEIMISEDETVYA